MTVHTFIDSGIVKQDSVGRALHICETCGKSNRGRGHGPQRLADGTPLPPVARKKAPKPIVPRPVRILALALDEVLALPMDVIGWRTYVRATDLRASITDVPRDPEQIIETVPKFEPVPEPMPKTRGGKVPASARARSMTKGIQSQNMRELATKAVEQGWTLERTGSGHYRLTKGSEHIVFAATTSDMRAWRNVRATMKRKGIDVG